MPGIFQTTGQCLVVFYFFGLIILGSFTFITSSAQAQSVLLPTTELTVGKIRAQAEIAATPASLQRGLMFRESLPPDHGMLFVFNPPQRQCFWMKNTPLPLSIAFIDAAGKIIDIQRMQPLSEQAHCPPGDIAYALEMEQGWFNRYGIRVKQRVQNLPPPR